MLVQNPAVLILFYACRAVVELFLAAASTPQSKRLIAAGMTENQNISNSTDIFKNSEVRTGWEDTDCDANFSQQADINGITHIHNCTHFRNFVSMDDCNDFRKDKGSLVRFSMYCM